MPYRRLSFLLPPDLEDALVDELWLAGTQGVQSVPGDDGRLRVEAYFPAGEDDLGIELPGGVELASDEVLPDADWFASWRERARPFPVGRTLFIDPREPGEAPEAVPPGRTLLRLPARAAFGTGSHESTSLALELLEDAPVSGRRVLDVGTGTGVLAFAALLGGARSVVAFDLDLASPFHARDNCALNRLRPRLFAGPASALRERPLFDLALVNVVPEQILPEMPDLILLLRPGAELILSGILAERGRQVLGRMHSLGFVEQDRRTAGDWVAFRVARADAEGASL
ncbi:MAG TPA: 50S ribosomal protein L11 methyltransferase [Thermoanaerobaculia bacterium]|nr:50S ribosomal protein L11 methyltransferase [Thermoanaerobaculia bacterium]